MKVKVISLQYIFQVLYVLCFARPRYQVSVYRTNGPLVSSPEPKAQRRAYSIPVELSSVCVSVNIFKLEYLLNQWANRNEILSELSLGWGCIRFWARSDRNSSIHGNG